MDIESSLFLLARQSLAIYSGLEEVESYSYVSD